MNTITVIFTAITIAAAITMIALCIKDLINIRRQRKRLQAFQAHIDELVEDLDKTWAGT